MKLFDKRNIIAVFVLFFASLALVGTQVSQSEPFSPIDEYVYFDYVAKVPSQILVVSGEMTGPEAREEISCRGVMIYGTYGDPCGSGNYTTDTLYPYEGRTGADIYSPFYFAPTWALSEIGVSAGMNQLDSSRLTGVLWLSLGAIFLFVLMRQTGVRYLLSLGIALLVLALPSSLWSSAFISTDAPTLALVSLLAIFAYRLIRDMKYGYLFAVIAPIAVLFKVQNLAAVGVLSLWVIISYFQEQKSDDKLANSFWKNILNALGTFKAKIGLLGLGLSVLAQVAWLLVRKSLALDVPPASLGEEKNSLSLQALVDESAKYLTVFGSSGMSENSVEKLVVVVFSVLAITAVLGQIIWAKYNSKTFVLLSISLLAGLIVMGPLLAVSAWLVSGYYFPLPVRYGIVYIPIAALLIAQSLKQLGKYTPVITVISGAALFFSTLVT
jgi:hypothetical protein